MRHGEKRFLAHFLDFVAWALLFLYFVAVMEKG
jgi:hypothetical protein